MEAGKFEEGGEADPVQNTQPAAARCQLALSLSTFEHPALVNSQQRINSNINIGGCTMTASLACPPGPGWVAWLGRGVCVWAGLRGGGVAWEEGGAVCRAQHPAASLPSLHSRPEHLELHQLVAQLQLQLHAPDTSFWLGARRGAGQRDWAWQDGSAWDWAGAWLPGQPSPGAGDMCAKTRWVRAVPGAEPYWYDVSCDNRWAGQRAGGGCM